MPKKILLADDSITIQKVVELTFSDGDYEVTAVNNGAKAVARLAEVRPDIILSDIIMPEKNGYEVCEYVKSNPEFRNIPVVLLTGTFEPFDPDRAEKAGCDAVVTKPFESQSLIHKVEELIAQSRANASSAAAEPAAEPEATSPWMDDSGSTSDADSAFSTASGAFTAAPPAPVPYTHDADIFAAAPAPEATTEMPFEMPTDSPFGGSSEPEQFSGETRAFPRMSFEDLQAGSTPQPEPTPAAEPSPWDEPAAASPFGGAPVSDQFSGETRAFQKMSFDDFASPAAATPAEEEQPAESPFGASPEPEQFSGETRAFPRMSFDELQQMQSAPQAPAAETTPEPPAAASPWDDDAPAFSGETRAFPKMSFDDMQSLASAPPTPEAPIEPAPWGEPAEDAPAFGGETRAFPKLSFDDLQQQAPMSAPEPAPEVPSWSSEPEPASPFGAGDDEAAEVSSPFAAPEPEPVESLWSQTAETNALDSGASESFSTAGAAPFADAPAAPEDLPFSTETTPVPAPIAEEPTWSPAAAAEAQAEPEEPVVPPPALAPEAPPMAIAARSNELSDDQIDRIARRVVELMSDQVVRNIAWEVIPDLAEMVVKERIRQLEAEG